MTNLCRVGGRVGGGVADVVVVAVDVAARLVTGAFSPVAATVDATAT